MLKRVGMKNFMCFADKTVEFGEHMTLISAENGKGKTTVATALLWAMFNCDYTLKSNPDVRMKVDGKAVEDDLDVEVEFEIGDTTFRKVQKRKHKKDSPEYSDTNEYYVRDVSCTMKNFNDQLGADLKKMLMGCNINAFLSEKPELLRSYLFGKIENINDLDFASESEDLKELAPLLQKNTADEIKSIHKKNISDLKKVELELKGQIKEKENDIIKAGEIDVSGMEARRNDISEQIKTVEGQIESNEQLFEERKKLSDGVLELKFKLSDMERKANEKNINRRRELQRQIDTLSNAKTDAERQFRHNADEIARLEKDIPIKEELTEKYRDEWRAAESREFDETKTICPYCGQELPEDKKEPLRTEFEQKKKAEKDEIAAKGNRTKEIAESEKRDLERLKTANAEYEKKIPEMTARLQDLQRQYDEIPQSVDISDTEEYQNLKKEIADKEQAMDGEFSADNVRQELKAQLRQLQEEEKSLIAEIGKADTTEHRQRLEELRDERLEKEQSKADSEKILYLLDTLEQRKNDLLNDRVNSMFGLVKFQLYRLNKSGGYENVCIPMVDGKSLLDNNANKALKILGKIDICNTIQKLEGFDLPIILDDGESLDGENLKKVIAMTDRQLIILKVTDDLSMVAQKE